jgi:hypothetical protein
LSLSLGIVIAYKFLNFWFIFELGSYSQCFLLLTNSRDLLLSWRFQWYPANGFRKAETAPRRVDHAIQDWNALQMQCLPLIHTHFISTNTFCALKKLQGWQIISNANTKNRSPVWVRAAYQLFQGRYEYDSISCRVLLIVAKFHA